jgi:hypothetical protein
MFVVFARFVIPVISMMSFMTVMFMNIVNLFVIAISVMRGKSTLFLMTSNILDEGLFMISINILD